jgi:phosphoribosylformylglycinamidine synthase
MKPVQAMVLTGYGLNCDYETDFSLKLAGAASHRIHINECIQRAKKEGPGALDRYDIVVFGGGFSWADDHGAGVLMASKLKNHLGEALERFIEAGKLLIGICNGFQVLVNLGFLPAFENRYHERRAALIGNDSGNFIDTWVSLKVNPESPCVFTRGLASLELPVRHGEGKFYARREDIECLFAQKQVVLQYGDGHGREAGGRWPLNPNGSLSDIAGICDPTGRIFGIMPHPEAFNHFTNHPDWTRRKEALRHSDPERIPEEGDGIQVFRNAVAYIRDTFGSR